MGAIGHLTGDSITRSTESPNFSMGLKILFNHSPGDPSISFASPSRFDNSWTICKSDLDSPKGSIALFTGPIQLCPQLTTMSSSSKKVVVGRKIWANSAVSVMNWSTTTTKSRPFKASITLFEFGQETTGFDALIHIIFTGGFLDSFISWPIRGSESCRLYVIASGASTFGSKCLWVRNPWLTPPPSMPILPVSEPNASINRIISGLCTHLFIPQPRTIADGLFLP